MKKILLVLLTFLTVFSLAACGESSTENDKPRVQATLFPQYDMARALAGDYIDLEFVVPAGVTAHTYEPGPRKVINILESDLLLYTGDLMEPWVSRLIANDSNNSNLSLLDLSENVLLIDESQRKEDHDDSHDHDDHEDSHDQDDHHDNHDEHDHGETSVDVFEILNRQNDNQATAVVHGDHWDGSLPTVEVGEYLSLGAYIESDDGRHRELDSDGEHNGFTVSLYDGASEGIVELTNHGDHVYITGLSEGVTQVVFTWTHDGEDRFTTPPLNVTVSEDGDDSEQNHGVLDPHFWLDPLNAEQMVLDIRDALIELVPEHEEHIRQNADDYIDSIESLHEEMLRVQQNVEHNIVMHGGHNAFNYFMNRYNIEYVTPYRGYSTDAEPTPGAIQEMIDKMDEYNVNYLFSEKLISESVSNTISEQTNAEILYIYDGENAPVDEFNDGITFLDMMRHNIEQYKIGLNYNE